MSCRAFQNWILHMYILFLSASQFFLSNKPHMAPCSELQKVVSKNYFYFRKILEIHKKNCKSAKNAIDYRRENLKLNSKMGAKCPDSLVFTYSHNIHTSKLKKAIN